MKGKKSAFPWGKRIQSAAPALSRFMASRANWPSTKRRGGQAIRTRPIRSAGRPLRQSATAAAPRHSTAMQTARTVRIGTPSIAATAFAENTASIAANITSPAPNPTVIHVMRRATWSLPMPTAP